MIARLPVQANPVTCPAISQRSRLFVPRKARRRRSWSVRPSGRGAATWPCLPPHACASQLCWRPLYGMSAPRLHPKPSTRSHPAASTPAIATSAERPRLSLVVLPFINLGGESMDDATVDALTEDLTSDLARVYDLFVIGRSSAFTYKGKPIDIKRVGEELGVRYVVEGSVRKADGTLRVNVQLVVDGNRRAGLGG